MFCISYYLLKRTLATTCGNDLTALLFPQKSEENNLIRKNFLHMMLFTDIYYMQYVCYCILLHHYDTIRYGRLTCDHAQKLTRWPA